MNPTPLATQTKGGTNIIISSCGQMASHDVEYVIYYLLTGSAHCSLGLRWVLDPLFQSLATHTCVHTHINTHTHTHTPFYTELWKMLRWLLYLLFPLPVRFPSTYTPSARQVCFRPSEPLASLPLWACSRAHVGQFEHTVSFRLCNDSGRKVLAEEQNGAQGK